MNWLKRLLFGRTRWFNASRQAQTTPVETWAEGPPPSAQPHAPPPVESETVARFQTVASEQLGRGLADRIESVRLALRRAFTPSQPVTAQNRFAGRRDTLGRLVEAIEGQRLHVVIYGERGVGKTSMLHVLSQAAKDARYLVIYVSCGAASEFDEVMRTIASEIPLLYHSGHGPTSAATERGETFANVMPEEGFTVRTVSELFGTIVGTRVLVLLDEFDRCESVAFRRSMAELMKSLSDRAAKMQFVIAGVAENVTDLIEYLPSIRRNVLALPVAPMSAAEVRDLVKVGATASGLTFEPDATDAVVAVAHGSPYIATLLSHYAGLAALEMDRVSVNASDVGAAVDLALQELSGRLSQRTRLLVTDCVRRGIHQTLAPVARHAQVSGGRFDFEQLAPLFDATSLEQTRQLADRLAEQGALLEARDDEFGRQYRFFEETVPSYLWMSAARETMKTEHAAPVEAATAAAAP